MPYAYNIHMKTKYKFEWNEQKNLSNQKNHGVSFKQACKAFDGPSRIIADNPKHSQSEKRYYLYGHDGNGILTVRFTLRDGIIRIIGAGYWRKGKKIYEGRKII